MRIAAGKYGGRVLKSPKDMNVRPTSDKVRQAIFNILLSYDLPRGACVLDGFCGSGALGIEALSRDAAQVVFLDKSLESLKLCQSNLDALQVADTQIKVLRRDVTKPGARPEGLASAGLVFLDPPYNKGLVPKALAALADEGWLADGALCVVETQAGEDDIVLINFTMLDDRRYGQTQIRFYRYQPRVSSYPIIPA